MSGRLYVIGTGPGNPQQTTPEALLPSRMLMNFTVTAPISTA